LSDIFYSILPDGTLIPIIQDIQSLWDEEQQSYSIICICNLI